MDWLRGIVLVIIEGQCLSFFCQVIYSLNTKNDDLEMDMEALRTGYEDKLQKVSTIITAPNDVLAR
jgi:hypothetical protein